MNRQLLDAAVSCAVIAHVSDADVCTLSATVATLDLCTCTARDQEFSTSFTLLPRTDGGGDKSDKSESTCHAVYGVVLWFDTTFSARHCATRPVVLSTAPSAPKTHWVQTMLHFHTPVFLKKAHDANANDDGNGTREAPASRITGRISFAKSAARPRSFDVSLEWKAGGGPSRAKLFKL